MNIELRMFRIINLLIVELKINLMSEFIRHTLPSVLNNIYQESLLNLLLYHKLLSFWVLYHQLYEYTAFYVQEFTTFWVVANHKLAPSTVLHYLLVTKVTQGAIFLNLKSNLTYFLSKKKIFTKTRLFSLAISSVFSFPLA